MSIRALALNVLTQQLRWAIRDLTLKSRLNSCVAALLQVKRSQDASFDVAAAAPRVIRKTTKWDGPRGGRVAPYQSAVKAYRCSIPLPTAVALTTCACCLRKMIASALKKLPGQQGTCEVCARHVATGLRCAPE